ncbi:MAG: hypothetical protein ABSH22_18465, partial [Tepidisphaeraceae bacterium]
VICYQPAVDIPVLPPPAQTNGFTTFASLNAFAKVNDSVLSLWARILREVPNSRLFLRAPEGSHRQRVLECVARDGITPDRITFVPTTSPAAYFEMYHAVDIALDAFPFGGRATTCDALWMGVPVITLAGQTPVGRIGLSILSNIGLSELAAKTPDEYVSLAVTLAGDVQRLTNLSLGLRQRMQSSPLMDAPTLACNVEAAYRTMWRKWCASPRPIDSPIPRGKI